MIYKRYQKISNQHVGDTTILILGLDQEVVFGLEVLSNKVGCVHEQINKLHGETCGYTGRTEVTMYQGQENRNMKVNKFKMS